MHLCMYLVCTVYNEIKTWVNALERHYQDTNPEIQTTSGLSLNFCLKSCFPDTNDILFHAKKKKPNLKAPTDCLQHYCAAPVPPSYHPVSPPAVLDLPQWQETTFFFYSQEIVGN